MLIRANSSERSVSEFLHDQREGLIYGLVEDECSGLACCSLLVLFLLKSHRSAYINQHSYGHTSSSFILKHAKM